MAGDVVRHLPSGEEWLVAAVDETHMVAGGWPPGRVPLGEVAAMNRRHACPICAP